MNLKCSCDCVQNILSPGRNRQLQGLAVAMAKLWERSSIAKIALKRGVQLTTSERMAEEIKVIIHTWSTFLTSGSNSLLICTSLLTYVIFLSSLFTNSRNCMCCV